MHQIGKNKVFLGIALVALLVLSSCNWGKVKGTLKPNTPPMVEIITDGGKAISDTTVIDQTLIDSMNVELFQQLIRWKSYDTDGKVEGYAFRILNKDRQPILPPPFECMQESDDPAENGWIYHYVPGADENVPLDSPEAEDIRQIWTNDVYATINFPANDSTEFSHADSVNIPSIFELKCIDDRGAESEIVTRAFFSYSVKPWVSITSDRGDISGETIGMGVRFKFVMNDADPYISSPPNYFEFKLKKIDFNTRALVEDGDWYKFKGATSSSSLLLTATTEPPLVSDFTEGTDEQNTYTIMEVRGYDMAGIVSEAKADTFSIKDGFYPNTLIYLKHSFLLGENHFIPYIEPQSEASMDFISTADGYRTATPFFKNKDGVYSAIYSRDLNIKLYWGYHGEFGLEEEAYPWTDNPDDKRQNVVLDELTDESYFSSIKAFDYRMDDKATFSPLDSAEYVITDPEDDKQWLRVPINDGFAQRYTFGELGVGHHTFEVRAVDDQDIADKTPAVLEFVLVEPAETQPQNGSLVKEGILVIDDDDDGTVPDDVLEAFYAECLSKYSKVDFINREAIKTSTYEKDLHFDKDVLSPSDLEPYKVVIYHSDDYNAADMTSFMLEYDVFNIYLERGGNLILTTGTGIAQMKNQYTGNILLSNYDIFEEYFGLNSVLMINTETGAFGYNSLISILGDSPLQNPYFVGAKSAIAGIPDVDLNMDGITETIGRLTRGGSGNVCYFDEAEDGLPQFYEPVMTIRVKDPSNPTQQEYQDKVCAVRYNKPVKNGEGNQTCYYFGFPLSSVGYDTEAETEDRSQVKALLESIIDPMMTTTQQ